MSIFNKYIAPYNKEAVALLDSNIEPETKLYFLRAIMNNLSKNFTKALNLQKQVSDRCKVLTERGNYTVCITTNLNTLTCRQFYKDLDGFYCYCIFSDSLYRVDGHSISTGGKCGTGNEKLSACNVNVPVSDGVKLTLQQFEEEVYV